MLVPNMAKKDEALNAEIAMHVMPIARRAYTIVRFGLILRVLCIFWSPLSYFRLPLRLFK
jgi:hypothetical protein